MNKLFTKIGTAMVGIAMAVGVGVAVGRDAVREVNAANVSSLVFTGACKGSGTADDGAEWSITSDAAESSYDSNRGVHYGTGSKAVEYIQATTEDISEGVITKVVVNASGGNSPSLKVTIGGSTFDEVKTGLTNSNVAYTFEDSKAAGSIVVKVYKSSAMNGALYLKSIAVTYASGTQYTVTLHANNGILPEVTSSSQEYSPYTIPSKPNSFVNPEHKKFSCWNSQADGNGTNYSVGGDPVSLTGNLDLYAKWIDADKVTVSFDAGDGSGAPSSIQVYEESSTELPSGSGMTAPSNKYFACWKDESDKIYNPGESVVINADITFTAQWATYDADDQIIVEPSYLNLATQYTSETTLIANDGVYYIAGPSLGNKVNNFDPATYSSDKSTLFEPTKEVVLFGKEGAYFYNKSPLGKRIKSISVTAPSGAASGHSLACEVSAIGPITSSISESTNKTSMTSPMSATALTPTSIIDNDNRFFRIEVVGADKNCQFQLKIELVDEAYIFARNLLKQTKGLCNSSYDGVTSNKAALTAIWTTLSGADYYGKLTGASLTKVVNAVASSTVVVPTTDALINEMSDADALAAAMYRYDYCTAKYSLTAFIEGRTLSVSFGSIDVIGNNLSNNSSTAFIIAISAIVGTFAIGSLFFIRRRKEDK